MVAPAGSFCIFFSSFILCIPPSPPPSHSSSLLIPASPTPALFSLTLVRAQATKTTTCNFSAALLSGCRGADGGSQTQGHHQDKVLLKEHGGSAGGDRDA